MFTLVDIFRESASASAELARQAAREAEAAGFTSILLQTHNGCSDPWSVATLAMSETQRLIPLIALNPVYMHPYFAAKKVATLAKLFDRDIWLNLVAGGFVNDLKELDQLSPHDDRYEKLTEYGEVMLQLLSLGEGQTTSYSGRHFTLRDAKFYPNPPRHRRFRILMAGSSDASRQAAERLHATSVRYPLPTEQLEPMECDRGIRVGIIARSSSQEAWDLAHASFPDDRRSRMQQALAVSSSDSQWRTELHAAGQLSGERHGAYWLRPFMLYKGNSPWLVGSYEEVAAELSKYWDSRHNTLLINKLGNDEFVHIRRAVDLVSCGAA